MLSVMLQNLKFSILVHTANQVVRDGCNPCNSCQTGQAEHMRFAWVTRVVVPQRSFGRQHPEKHEVSLLHNMKVDNGRPCEEFIEGSNLQNKILLA